MEANIINFIRIIKKIYIYINIQYMKYVFNEKDYQSDNGMITYIWGPLLWHFLHIMSFNYPTNPEKYNKKNNYNKGFIQSAYYNFIRILQYILPCGACRDTLKQNLDSLNFFDKETKKQIFRDRDHFSLFIFNLHETVNTMLKKKSNLKYEEIKDFYEHFRAYCPKEKKNNHTGCVKLKHNSKERVKPKVILYFVPYTKKMKTTKIHKKCDIRCVHEG